MKTIIESIQAKLAKIPALNYVDEDWGQLDHYSPNFPVKWPCALIDIQAGQYENIGWSHRTQKYGQTGDFMVSITLANLKLTNTSFRAPVDQKAAGFSIWDLFQTVHDTIQGFRPDANSGALIRQGFRRVKRDDGVQEYTLLYGFGATDV